MGYPLCFHTVPMVLEQSGLQGTEVGGGKDFICHVLNRFIEGMRLVLQ